MLLQHTLTRNAQQQPSAIALVDRHEALTYGDLDALSNRIARLLVNQGCRKGDRVALLLPKSHRAIAAMFGALKAAAIYVPIDTASPPARVARILDICEPALILCAEMGAALLSRLHSERRIRDNTRIGRLDDASDSEAGFPVAFDWADCLSVSAAPVDHAAAANDPAHILFTSGSTGLPKGVVITHANVIHFLKWATRYFGTSSSDRISCHPPLHFDLSTFDVYGTLMAGGELHLIPADAGFLPTTLAATIRDRALTQWFSVPSLLKYMAQFDVIKPGDFPSLKRVLWCGEALPTATLIYWMKRLPHVSFTNLYGPTETTIASSYYTVPECPASDQVEIPIGAPCEGETLLVLDESMHPAPPSHTGNLYIGGVGLSPGYWRDPEKTASVFLELDGRRIYRTGDLARVGVNGELYLLGRADSQIKSRGYRIELGEIETALHSLQAVRECAVVAIPSNGFEGTAICCAYVGDASPSALCAQLGQIVPAYMLPSRWLAMARLPLNGNGKLDRPGLRQQFQESTANNGARQ